MKKVLMVIYSFPPLKNPGAERAISFVKQLHHYGWEPLVLTHETGLSVSTESGDQEPDGIDIVRTRSWTTVNLPRPLRAAANFFASCLLPDKERLWEQFSARKAVRMVKNEGVDLVYTVSPPSSSHLIGLRLKKKYPRVPWVADLCALHTAGHLSPVKPSVLAPFSPSVKEHYEKKLLDKIADRADCIVTGDEAVLQTFLTRQTDVNTENIATLVSDGHVQELSELFEKACRAIAARKLVNN